MQVFFKDLNLVAFYVRGFSRISSFLCKGSSPNFASNIKHILKKLINFSFPSHQKTYGFLIILRGIEVNQFA